MLGDPALVNRNEFQTRIAARPSVKEIFATIVARAHELGFEYCAYGLCTSFPFSRPKFIIESNYPLEWQNRYKECGYLALDPTVKYGLNSTLPSIWTEDIFASAYEFWEDAAAFGLKVGWMHACHQPGGVTGMLTLSRSHESISSSELIARGLDMLQLATSAHISMAGHSAELLRAAAKRLLSAREREVLRWTAEGKTSGEIADIMTVSERTVNFHITNAMRKLDVCNKTSAAVVAAISGNLY